ncbi:relaxase domain-containing protein [Nocardioides sp. B-3]|uniref:relaxase domain-containing protein n=1 Tax=Nocardioides sp. B-3 TaxID=2895565 RepID=UPI002153251D|nr:relaxase domain-containing protein [Nocardioides sp. B-3]UUZ60963.1 relaxase domain-containing protein [Nocardioides sp. B-3]
MRFVEVVINGPKSRSLAAALHPDIAAAYDSAMHRAAGEVIGWVAEHATTRVGPRGRQVQVPVEMVEAAVVRHYTSRAGDPHRHLHVQINARVFARGVAWTALGRCRRQHRGAQRDRARGRDVRPRIQGRPCRTWLHA